VERTCISEDLSDKLIDQLKSSHFAMQVDETTNVVKDAYLITYVWYVLENDMKETFMFCKPIDGRTTSLEVFSIVNHVAEQNEINRTALDSALIDQSVSGQNVGLQALVRKKAPHIICTHCMLQRQTFASGSMSKELQTVF